MHRRERKQCIGSIICEIAHLQLWSDIPNNLALIETHSSLCIESVALINGKPEAYERSEQSGILIQVFIYEPAIASSLKPISGKGECYVSHQAILK